MPAAAISGASTSWQARTHARSSYPSRTRLTVRAQAAGPAVNVSYSRQWVPVAQDLKARLSPILELKKDKLDQLMIWLGETQFAVAPKEEAVKQMPVWESDAWRAEYCAIADILLQQWLGSAPRDDAAAKCAGLVALRTLQAYKENTGMSFDSSDTAYACLHEDFLHPVLVTAVDREFLQRLLSTFLALPSEKPDPSLVPRPATPPGQVDAPAAAVAEAVKEAAAAVVTAAKENAAATQPVEAVQPAMA